MISGVSNSALGVAMFIKWIAAAGVICGFFLLCVRFTVGSDTNWCPTTLPFPNAGVVVSYPFHIASGGRFELEAISPISTGNSSIPAIQQASCDLTLIISNERGFAVERHTKSLRHSARNVFCRLDYFVSDPIDLPKRGDYVIHVTDRIDIVVLAEVRS